MTEQGRPSQELAAEPEICIDTLRSWLKASGIVEVHKSTRGSWKDCYSSMSGGEDTLHKSSRIPIAKKTHQSNVYWSGEFFHVCFGLKLLMMARFPLECRIRDCSMGDREALPLPPIQREFPYGSRHTPLSVRFCGVYYAPLKN